MKRIFTFLLCCFVLSSNAQLIITAAYDGPLSGGTPKGIELYVTEDIPDLSIFGVGSANNGGGTDGEEFTLPAGSASCGDYIYVATEAANFTNFFGFAPNYTSGSMAINGDDAIELFKNGAVIDVFGDINTDGTGQPWDYLDGWAYRNNDTGPDGSSFNVASWSFSGVNALDGESDNNSASTPVPVGTFTHSTYSCSSCDGPDNIALAPASATTTYLPIDACDHADGFTYYGDGTGDYFFAINWAPDGSLDPDNEAAKDMAQVQITTNAPGDIVNATHGTWTMERYWNVLNETMFNEPVSVKFYHLATEISGTDADRDASGIGNIETSVWFKTVGQAFDPNMLTPSSVGQGAIELTATIGSDNGVQYAQFDGITSFSGGTYAAGAGDGAAVNALPVNLVSFDAEAMEEGVKLSWATAQEVDNDYFAVERSADGYRFEVIDMVQGQGNTNKATAYKAMDEAPITGVSYYRLAQYDFDGTVAYSAVKPVTIEGKGGFKIFPTVVDGELNYQTGLQGGTMNVLSADGQLVLTQVVRGNGSVDASALAAGVYYVQFVAGNNSETFKITKL